MLATGQATSLRAAQAETILEDLCIQRDELATLLADLRRQEPASATQSDKTSANLIAAINLGIIQIDLFIAEARTHHP